MRTQIARIMLTASATAGLAAMLACGSKSTPAGTPPSGKHDLDCVTNANKCTTDPSQRDAAATACDISMQGPCGSLYRAYINCMTNKGCSVANCQSELATENSCLGAPSNAGGAGGGSAGNGGSKTGGADGAVQTGADSADGAAQPGADGGGGVLCTTTTSCPSGQQCLGGQCCVPPAAGGECNQLPACGCTSGKVCSPSSTTHAMACITAGNLGEGGDCSTSASLCQPGLGCFGGTCKRYCSIDSDCPPVGTLQHCAQTTWSDTKADILGVKVCGRICDPAHPQNPTAPLLACPAGFGCKGGPDGLSSCYKTSPLPAGSTCSGSEDCNPGYYCTQSGRCNGYCLASSDCPSGQTCHFTFTTSEFAGSYQVGYCSSSGAADAGSDAPPGQGGGNPTPLDAAADVPHSGTDGQLQGAGGSGGGGADGSGGTDAMPAGLIPGYTAPWSGSGDPWAGTTGELVTVTSPSGSDTPDYTLTGTTADGVTTIHMEFGGARADIAPQDGVFSTQVTLDPGVNDIYLVVDNAGGPLPPLHVVVVLITGNPSSVDLIEAALAAGSITAEQALEYEVFAAFGDPRLPSALAGDDSLLLVEPIMATVAQAAPTLSDDAKDVIGPFLVPDSYQGSAYDQRTQPSQHLQVICNPLRGKSDCVVSSNWTYFDGTRVRVWYEKGRSAQKIKSNTFDGFSDLAAATAVVSTLDTGFGNAWDTLSALMRTAPISDGKQNYNGGDGKLDILLVDMVGADGLTTPNNGNGDINKQTPVFIRLNRNRPVDKICGAAVHEFMHAIQFALPLAGSAPNAYLTLMEGTANWAANEVLPTNDWEHQYNWFYFTQTERQLDSVTDPLTDVFPYGTWVFFLYLTERFKIDDVIPLLWSKAAETTDQLAIIADTVAFFSGSKDIAEVWQDFGVKLWNGETLRYFSKLDRIPDQPTTVDGGWRVALGATGLGSDTFDVSIPTFSTRYWSLLFNDANVRTLLFLNGMNFQLTSKQQMFPTAGKAPVTCPAVLPPPDPAKAKTAYLSAIPKRDGAWQPPENWTTAFAKGYNLSCRDDTSGVLNQLILVASYADATDKSQFQCPADQPGLVRSSSFCARAIGTASLQQPQNGIQWTLDTADFVWKRPTVATYGNWDVVAPLPAPGGYVVCGNTLDLAGGNITMTAIGTDSSGCTLDVDRELAAPTGTNESRINLFDFATAPAQRFYSFPGFGINAFSRGAGTLLFTGTRQCPGKPAEEASIVPDTFMFNSSLNQPPGNFIIPPNGILKGSGAASITASTTGAWSVSPF